MKPLDAVPYLRLEAFAAGRKPGGDDRHVVLVSVSLSDIPRVVIQVHVLEFLKVGRERDRPHSLLVDRVVGEVELPQIREGGTSREVVAPSSGQALDAGETSNRRRIRQMLAPDAHGLILQNRGRTLAGKDGPNP